MNISAKDPEDYFARLMETEDREFFEKNLIPLNKEFLEIGVYEKFLEERRRAICEALNTFIDGL